MLPRFSPCNRCPLTPTTKVISWRIPVRLVRRPMTATRSRSSQSLISADPTREPHAMADAPTPSAPEEPPVVDWLRQQIEHAQRLLTQAVVAPEVMRLWARRSRAALTRVYGATASELQIFPSSTGRMHDPKESDRRIPPPARP